MKYRAQQQAGPDRVVPTRFVSRASIGTYLDGSGILRTAQVDEARYQDGQLLLEVAGSNLALRSAEPDAWTGEGVTEAGLVVAPDLTTRAMDFRETEVAESHYVQLATFNVIAGQRYVISCFCRPLSSGDLRYVTLLFEAGPWGSMRGMAFNPVNGDLGISLGGLTEHGVIPVNGGFRFWAAYRALYSGSATTQIRISATQAATIGGYAGSPSNGLILWGKQAEAKVRGGPSSFIETSTVETSRAEDVYVDGSVIPTVEGDYQFLGRSPFLVDSPEAVAQAIRTRLRLTAGEWFLDDREGLALGSILGNQTQTTRDFEIKRRILATQGVESLTSYSSTVTEDRRFLVEATVQTIYGSTNINEVV